MAKERITGHTFNVFSSLFETGMNKKMDRSKLQVYLYLCYRANYKTGRSWPRVERICEDCDVSKPTAHAAIKWLSEEGLIAVERIYHHNSPHNYYTVFGCSEELGPMELESDEPYNEDEIVLPVRDPQLNALNRANETTVKPTLPCKVKPIIPSPEPYTIEPSPDIEVYKERKTVRKVHVPRVCNSTELFEKDEVPTRARQADEKIWKAYLRIHEIAGLGVPRTYRNKEEKPTLAKALIDNIDAERLGIALQKALETDEPKFWPINRVINSLHILEAITKPTTTKKNGRLTQEEIEESANKAWAKAFGGALVCDQS